jgi:Protein of unknown function (DUF3014)
MNKRRSWFSSYWGPIALALAAIAVAAYFWWQRQHAPEPPAPPIATPELVPAEPPPTAAASAASEPGIQHPVEAIAAGDPASGAAAGPPPALDGADAYMKNALIDLLGNRAVLSTLQVDSFARRMVATVDNLARSHAAPRMWPVNPMPGRFSVDGGADAGLVSAENSARYTPFVTWIESVDTRRAVALYVRAYPLLQQAYEELGYPGRYFNDRLVEVIDHLLKAPSPQAPLQVMLTEVKGPEKPARPWVRYEFSDPKLEALSSGQKMLVRVGPDNEERLKAKLTEIRRLVAGAPVPR